MLPFLKNKDKAAGISGVLVKNRTPDEKPEQDQDDSSAAIDACAHDLINAIHARDVKGVSEAIKSAMEILEDMPKEEPPAPHSYEDQQGE